MKKITILFLISLMVFLNNQAIAQKLIALQSGDKATFYTDLDTALYYAKNGDEIYLPGGYIKANPTTLKIDKAINIKGVGYKPYTNPATENTVIQSATIKIMPTVNGGSISGIYAKNSSLRIQDTVSNFLVVRCLLTDIYIGNGGGVVPPNNISITETIAENGIRNGEKKGFWPLNVSIQNCIIGNASKDTPLVGGDKWAELSCQNSIIIGSVIYGNPIIWTIYNSLFENCIFIEKSGCRSMQGYGCTFRNCIFNTSCGMANYSIELNSFHGQSEDLIFIDPQGFTYNMKNDYRLRDSSPGKNAGKDGTDIGIYGGRYPWKDSALPVNPHIETFNVAGKTDSIGNLRVKIKVAAQEN